MRMAINVTRAARSAWMGRSGEAHFAEQRGKPRVGAQVVEERPYFCIHQPMGVLLVGPVETVQRVILLAEPNVDQCHAKWRHIIRSRSLLQLVEDFPRFGALPSLAARIAERGARERRPTGKT